MKKIAVIVILLAFMITLASCVELEITEIDELKVKNLNVTEYFLREEIDLTNVQVEAYKDEQLLETVGLSDVVYTLKDPDNELITLEDNTFTPNKLGDYHLLVTYSDVSVSLKFFIGGEDGRILNATTLVYYDNVQVAIDSASENDVIYVGAGEYSSATMFDQYGAIYILTPGITLTTNPYTPAALLTSEEETFEAVLDIRARGVTVEYLQIQRNNATSAGQAIAVRHSDITLRYLDISSDLNGRMAITVDHGWPGTDGYGDGDDYSLVVENIVIENNTMSGAYDFGILVRSPGDSTDEPGSLSGVTINNNSIDVNGDGYIADIYIWVHSNGRSITNLQINDETWEEAANPSNIIR
jgi:hypothetical protein